MLGSSWVWRMASGVPLKPMAYEMGLAFPTPLIFQGGGQRLRQKTWRKNGKRTQQVRFAACLARRMCHQGSTLCSFASNHGCSRETWDPHFSVAEEVVLLSATQLVPARSPCAETLPVPWTACVAPSQQQAFEEILGKSVGQDVATRCKLWDQLWEVQSLGRCQLAQLLLRMRRGMMVPSQPFQVRHWLVQHSGIPARMAKGSVPQALVVHII